MQLAYQTVCDSIEDVLRREDDINAEYARRRQELVAHWRDLFVPADVIGEAK